MTRRVGTPKGAKKRCDELFSLIVRSRGDCQAFGRANRLCSPKLETAHIISRRFSNTRCVEANALCLCSSHHRFYTDNPVEWGAFVKATIGEAEYRRVYALSQETGKVDWFVVADALKARWAEVVAAA